MIAKAAIEREQRQQLENRRCAARKKAVKTLWEDIAERRRFPTRFDSPAVSPSKEPAPRAPSPQAPVPKKKKAPSAPRILVERNAARGEPPVVRKAPPTFADVLRTCDGPYRLRYADELTVYQDKVLREMTACYTPLLGTHEWTCGDCGTVVELPNGCNNRHCCTCGVAKRRRWAENTCAQVLPVEYAHLILTVPQEITQLAMLNKRALYSLVLSVGAKAVQYCGRKLFDVELALLSVLHTWGQLVLAHLHSHSLLAYGGLRVGKLEWVDLSGEQMQQLLELAETEFAKRFCKALRKLYDKGELQFEGDPELEHLESPEAFEQWIKPLENMAWVIRSPDVWDRREAGKGPEATRKVVEYLANYANRVALSDARILEIRGTQVLFSYKDYRDDDQQKEILLDGVELIRRFLQHLLPPKMHHIRRYGWVNPRVKAEKLAFLQEHFGMAQSDPEEKSEDAGPAEEEGRTQRCWFCTGTMHETDSTLRPRVWEVMEMPLERFRRAQAGVRVTLGHRKTLSEKPLESSANDLPPALRERAKEIRRQLTALFASGYL